jgi:hypothetical protein
LISQPETLTNGETDFLQADKIRGAIHQLRYQQMATFTPTIGAMTEVDCSH